MYLEGTAVRHNERAHGIDADASRASSNKWKFKKFPTNCKNKLNFHLLEVQL
jgi:hypothetical protein